MAGRRPRHAGQGRSRQADAGHRAALRAHSARGSSSSSRRAPASTASASCPVDGETLGEPGVYGDDRVFVRISTGADTAWHAQTDAALDALAEAGHPVLEPVDARRRRAPSAASSSAGSSPRPWPAPCWASIPFDEPNVTESKDNTKRVLDAVPPRGTAARRGAAADGGPLTLTGDAPLRLSGADGDVSATSCAATSRAQAERLLSHSRRTSRQPRNATARCATIATLLRDGTGRAVTVGYGPRFLHSTGQLHKGGAPIGCFIQLTAEPPETTWRSPAAHESFGTLIDAQAAGDFMSLESHDLPVVRINLSDDPDAGLAALRDAMRSRRSHEPLDPQRVGEGTSGARDRRSRPHGRQHGAPAAPGRPSGRRLQPLARQDRGDHRRGARGRLRRRRRRRACSARRASSG